MSTTRNSSFLWDVNGVDVRQLDDRYSIEHTPPNRSTLRISRLNSSDLGQIRCNGTDPIHVTVSAEASIMESMDLYIVGQLEGQTDHVVDERVEIQRDLVLVCAVRNAGMNTRSIRWFLGHRELMNGTEYSINSSGGTLTKNNISLNDEAGYLCRAEVETSSEPLELTFNVMVTSEWRYNLILSHRIFTALYSNCYHSPYKFCTRRHFFCLLCNRYVCLALPLVYMYKPSNH